VLRAERRFRGAFLECGGTISHAAFLGFDCHRDVVHQRLFVPRTKAARPPRSTPKPDGKSIAIVLRCAIHIELVHEGEFWKVPYSPETELKTRAANSKYAQG
jgi:hypothetical protein